MTYLAVVFGFYLMLGPLREDGNIHKILESNVRLMREIKKSAQPCFENFSGTLIVRMKNQYSESSVAGVESDPVDPKFLSCTEEATKNLIGRTNLLIMSPEEKSVPIETLGYLQPSRDVGYAVHVGSGKSLPIDAWIL